jgi:hypothetical protein
VREDATRESDFTLDDEGDEDDEENDWDGEVEWNEEEVEEAVEGDIADESAAYLEFLNKEAQKFSQFADDDDDELDEESLLETPLDKVEPYGMFKHVFLSMLHPISPACLNFANPPYRPPVRATSAL